MCKSIIVMDTPTSCEECNLCAGFMGKHYCPPRDTEVSKGERDCSCPLVAVPEKIDSERARNADEAGYIDGWNECLSKIVGGNDE